MFLSTHHACKNVQKMRDILNGFSGCILNLSILFVKDKHWYCMHTYYYIDYKYNF